MCVLNCFMRLTRIHIHITHEDNIYMSNYRSRDSVYLLLPGG